MNWGKYNLIDTPEKIKQVDDYLMDENGNPKFPLIAYDTETNGLYLYKTVIVGFSFSVDARSGFYVPILVWEPDTTSLYTRTKDKVKYEVYEHGRFRCFWTGAYYPEDVTPAEYKMPDFIPALVKRWFGKAQLTMWNAPFDVNHSYINFGVDLKDNLVVDGGLIAHAANENESVGLKESSILYRVELGINPFATKAEEKEELKGSVIRNGGNGVEVWRADLQPQAKYAIADTFLTYGLTPVILEKLAKEHGPNYSNIDKWIFDYEIMPVCKEVVIDMKRRGVYIDVPHFSKLSEQNAIKLVELESSWMNEITPFLDGFDKGKSIDEAVSHQRLVKEIIAMEGLKIPQVQDKKTLQWKDSIAKGIVKKEYDKNPHWIWAYILGEDEIKYSADKLAQVKQKLYEEVTGRRYRFNIGSNDHLIWLFFTKLGENPRKFPKTEKSTEEDWTPSLDADTIREHLLEKFPWVNLLLKYKKIQKIQSTYVLPALEFNISGWLYMDMKQNGTTSGRFSCSGGYNLQTLPRVDDEKEALEKCSKCDSKNIEIDAYIEVMANRHCKDCGHVEYDIVRPSAIKKGFIAPPGYKIINADYSSLEPRCFAYVSEEDNIKQVYRDNLDLYSKVYCDIFDKENQYSADPKAPNFLKKKNGKARTFIKPLVLGIPYGAGEAQVANLAGYFVTYIDEHHIKRQRPDMTKGKELRSLYLRTYPKLQYYMLEREIDAVVYGFVDAKYGRRRHLEYAPTIARLLHSKFNAVDTFYTSHDFTYVNKLVEKYEEEGRLTEERLQACRILEACYTFMYIPRRNMTKPHFAETNKDSGLRMTLTSEDLRYLCKSFNMRLFNDEPGFSDPVSEKGFWAYFRNLLKADLNNAKNHPIQGLAGHITNIGMLSTTRLFKQNNIDGWVCLQVHDEIMAYARTDQAELAKTLLQQGMENNMFTDPLKQEVVMIAEPVICDSLKEAK